MVSNQLDNYKSTEIGLIPNGWKITFAEEFCKRVTDGTHATPQKQKQGHYLITSRHIKEGYLDFENAYFINDKDFEDANKRSWVSKWDIIFGMIGTIGEVYLEKSNKIDYAIKNVGLFNCGNEVLGKWLFFYMKSRMAKDYIRKNRSGTTQEYMTLESLRKFPIAHPQDRVEMQAIVTFLDSIQNKIALNKRMNKTFEAVGAALFKRWFVDFEFPNEEGKPYKSTGGKTVDSLFGEIPSDWQVGGLGDICEIVMGQSPPGETYNETGEGSPFFQGIRDFGFRFPSKRVYCTAPTRFAEEGDVLLSVRAPVGSLNIADQRCAIGRGVAALRLKGKQNSFLYYLLLATRTAWDKYDSKGTVFGSATKQDIYDFRIIIPSKELRDKFGQFMEPLDKKILLNERESRSLTAIRDLLLPKLMSGRIRVPVNKENVEAS